MFPARSDWLSLAPGASVQVAYVGSHFTAVISAILSVARFAFQRHPTRSRRASRAPRARQRRARLRSHPRVHERAKPPHRHLVLVEPIVADGRRKVHRPGVDVAVHVVAAVVHPSRDLGLLQPQHPIASLARRATLVTSSSIVREVGHPATRNSGRERPQQPRSTLAAARTLLTAHRRDRGLHRAAGADHGCAASGHRGRARGQRAGALQRRSRAARTRPTRRYSCRSHPKAPPTAGSP